MPPASPNEVWVGDITYIPMTNGGFLYLSVWMDLYSRKIVGWDLQDNMRESLVIESLQKALNVRRLIQRLLLHSDRGGQYAGTDFRKNLVKHNILQSMSDADNPNDNAPMESFFAEMLEWGIITFPVAAFRKAVPGNFRIPALFPSRTRWISKIALVWRNFSF